MAKVSLILRTLYLYAFAMLGLVLLTIGSVRLLDMGLRATLFKQADALDRMEMPPVPMFTRTGTERFENDEQLTPQERDMLRQALFDYEQWRKRRNTVDPVTARRQREAASSLAMILVGLPLYLYHWRLIRHETEARRRRMPPPPTA